MAARIRRRDASGHVDPFFQRRRRYEAVLGALGLADLFTAMPRRAQELFCMNKFPDPVLEFAEGFPDDRDGRALRKRLESRFREASMQVDCGEVTVRDFFSVLAGLKHTVLDTRDEPGVPEPCVRFVREAGPLLDYWYEHHIPDAWPALHSAVTVPLIANSRLDARLLTATVKQDFTANGKYLIRMTARATEPQERRVPLDGAVRPMYRVGTANAWEGVSWLSWNAAQFGRDRGGAEAQREYPVYVQSHALRQLHKRINLPKTAPYLECWLHDSLKEPRIVERHGGDLLVEFRLGEHRIGYLIVTPLKDLVAVRTFVFLTMERTPERRMLERRLRLTRHDVDWLGLHELSAFTQTDLREDPTLRRLMEECGCGHLFALADDASASPSGAGGGGAGAGSVDYAPRPKAFAAEMRRYLRLAA